jgi:hypothetical protein
VTWETVSTVVSNIAAPPASYPNTNFRDGIENTFAVGRVAVNGVYPLYVSWEDYSAGYGNLNISASFDGGLTWSASPVKVNDNPAGTDAFQPNLATAANGRVLVAFYDRRLACPDVNSTEGKAAGLQLDPNASNKTNWCVNASLQVFDVNLNKVLGNIRLSQHTWDPQLNSMKPSGINRPRGFIGDYFGVDTGVNDKNQTIAYTSSVSTYNDGTNKDHYQQQVVASLTIP